MTLESPRVPEDCLGSLGSCLVEGDRESEKRARRLKQRAVAVSVALQTLALTALGLFPLLSKGEHMAFKYATPVPPYAPVGERHHSAPADPGRHTPRLCGAVCARSTISPITVTHDPKTSGGTEEKGDDLVPGVLPGENIHGGLDPGNSGRPVPPPPDDPHPVRERWKISELQQMSQLITRVEPRYPPLAIQIRREGRVELHAIISTNGAIESLEVVSGDPLFIQSALSAVRQWRYRPTILNNRPVEVDTYITVIYTLNR